MAGKAKRNGPPPVKTATRARRPGISPSRNRAASEAARIVHEPADLQALNQSLHDAEADVQQTRQQAAGLTGQVREAHQRLRELQQDLQATAQELQDTLQQVEAARLHLGATQVELRAAQEQAQQLHEEVQVARAVCHADGPDWDQARRERQQALEQWPQIRQRLQQQADAAVDDIRHQAERTREQLRAVQGQVPDPEPLRQKVSRWSDELDRKHREAEQHVQELQKGFREAARLLLQEFHLHRAEVRKQAEDATQELRSLEQDVHNAAASLPPIQEDIEATRRQLQAAKQALRQSPPFVPTVSPDAPSPGDAVALAPAEMVAVKELILVESPADRLVRYLNDAWAVEKELLDELQDLADEGIDPEIRSLLGEHRRVTHQQAQDLEERIRALGKEPSGGKGFFSRTLARIGDALHRSSDKYDGTIQDLMKAYATEHLEAAMYQTLAAYAEAIGDGETARLARRHLDQERDAADKLWARIGPVANLVRQAQEGPQGTPHSTTVLNRCPAPWE